jgi:alpha-beta hydrolase superfamily lysophospholipase
MPVLLVVGARDTVFDSKKTAARFERLVEDVDVRMFPAAGHALINVAPVVAPFLVEAAADPVVG